MGDIKEVVEYYVARLSSAEREDAWHRLVEAGPAALPHVRAALEATTDVGVQVERVRVLAEYRSADAVPFLADMLSHAQQALWKQMLGHANISQTSTYLNATLMGLHRSMKALDRKRKAEARRSRSRPRLQTACKRSRLRPWVL